jgi:hypothetical protein
MAFRKKENEREDVLELGADTDAQICKELGGTMGSDRKCRVVKSGTTEEGEVKLKVTKGSNLAPPPGD